MDRENDVLVLGLINLRDRGAPGIYPKKQRCKRVNCGTVLHSYHKYDTCWSCINREFRRQMIVGGQGNAWDRALKILKTRIRRRILQKSGAF